MPIGINPGSSRHWHHPAEPAFVQLVGVLQGRLDSLAAMNKEVQAILQSLQSVAQARKQRVEDAWLGQRALAIKAFQHARFEHTYADLLASPRYAGAANFFLDDLYGPRDFSRRDAQFARVVPALVRLFPSELTQTVKALGELHALAEILDSAMAGHVEQLPIDAAAYGRAWRLVGRKPDRWRQIELLQEVGAAMDVYTTKPLLRHALRMMRGPARAAGLGELQNFLETGFDTFRAMAGAKEFLETIDRRERSIADALFEGNDDRPLLRTCAAA